MVDDDTHKRLAALGGFGDSYQDIIKRLLDNYENPQTVENIEENGDE
jgi:hypothetical protein